jgi:DNA-directed RNA polymerase specialized sigma24 family protein
MTSEGSVTHWIRELRAGNHEAARRLWEGYFQRLVVLARHRLLGTRRRAADEEDVALSAFDSFCCGAAQGNFPRLEDRNDLWQLLVVLTARKALDLRQYERRKKRGGGAVRGESVFAGVARAAADEPGIERVVSAEPGPDFAAQVADECRHLFDRLGDDELRSVALWKMEGHTNPEIAARLGCAPATVERRLRMIRTIWAEELSR